MILFRVRMLVYTSTDNVIFRRRVMESEKILWRLGHVSSPPSEYFLRIHQLPVQSRWKVMRCVFSGVFVWTETSVTLFSCWLRQVSQFGWSEWSINRSVVSVRFGSSFLPSQVRTFLCDIIHSSVFSQRHTPRLRVCLCLPTVSAE